MAQILARVIAVNYALNRTFNETIYVAGWAATVRRKQEFADEAT
jgi:hypothetical protein